MHRIVFVHPDGLHQIMGTDEGMATLPVTAEGFVVLGRAVPFASLYRVTPRIAYYKEPMMPSTHSTFNPRQQ